MPCSTADRISAGIPPVGAAALYPGGMGIAPRVNGAAPPDVPLSEINLGSWDFWALDDDIRDGAFATLRREAPISFHPADRKSVV